MELRMNVLNHLHLYTKHERPLQDITFISNFLHDKRKNYISKINFVVYVSHSTDVRTKMEFFRLCVGKTGSLKDSMTNIKPHRDIMQSESFSCLGSLIWANIIHVY